MITPEMLIHCRELVSINVIPQLQGQPDPDPDFKLLSLSSSWTKLQKVKHNLIRLYNEEFIGNLISQAVNEKDRFKPVKHKPISVGDIVLIKEPLCKSTNYPIGRVKEVITNINDEVTGVKVLKGKSGEILKRHISSIIPLLSAIEDTGQRQEVGSDNNQLRKPPKRQAAIQSAQKTRDILVNTD